MSFSHRTCLVVLWTFALLRAAVHGCTIQHGIRYKGGVIATLSAIASQDVCCFECRANPNCNAFTFYVNGTNANKCVLTLNITTVTADVTAVSGVSTGICSFEDNVEYPLYTLSEETQIPNKESCCNFCGTSIKCVAFTYFKSGPKAFTCATKYAVSARIPSPNLSAGTLTAGVCAYQDGFDSRGFDLQSLPNVPSKALCCAACQTTPKCSAFTYAMSGAKAKTCILKSSSVNKIANLNAVSSTVTGVACGRSGFAVPR